MPVKGVIAALMMLVLIAAPAYAMENTTEAGETLAASEVAGGKVLRCPHCGRDVVTGRHGQAGQTMCYCPHCGKEIPLAEEAGPFLCFGADMGIFDRYVSRGMVTTDDPVFQPNVWLSYRDFTVSVWGNMDLTGINSNEGEFNELDFTLDYCWRWGDVNFSAGGIYYVFPNTGSGDTAELYAAVGYDTLLQPTLTVFYDFVDIDGFYANLGIGHCFELPLPVEDVSAGLELSMQLGWGSKNFNSSSFGSEHGAFTDMVFTAGIPVTLLDNFTIRPAVSYSTVLDNTIRTKNSGNDNIVLGATLSASF